MAHLLKKERQGKNKSRYGYPSFIDVYQTNNNE